MRSPCARETFLCDIPNRERMSQDDRKVGLLAELTLLRERLDKLKKENEDLRAITEQIGLENEDLKREVREMLEQTQELRGLI